MGVKGVRKGCERIPAKKQPTKKGPDNHKRLCERGAKWLKGHSENILVPNCQIVAVELFTAVEPEIPDIIGWSGWCSILIEVKVQRPDFLKDCKKPFRATPSLGVGELRFYLCPEGLIKEHELPANWGLLYETTRGIKIIKKAERQVTNLAAERNMLTSLIRNRK